MSGVSILKRGLIDTTLPNEAHMEVYPKIIPRGAERKPAAIYVHGASGYATTTLNWLNDGKPHWTDDFTDAGYVCFGADLGGPQTWGNATATNLLGKLIAYTQTVPGVMPGPVILYFHSMGGLTSMNWIGASAANRAKIACCVAVTPVVNLNDIKVNNRTGYAGLVDAAYGGNYQEATLGSTRNPRTIANTGAYNGLPYLCYYGLTDTTCVPAETEAFARVVGPSMELIPLTSGHDDTSYRAVDNHRLLEFMEANS